MDSTQETHFEQHVSESPEHTAAQHEQQDVLLNKFQERYTVFDDDDMTFKNVVKENTIQV